MKKLATRSAQYPLFAEFVFQHNDWVVDSVDQVKKTLGSTVALSADPAEPGLLGPVANTIVFDAINMPPYAVITGGEVIVETAYAGSTAATLSLGIAGSTTALVNETYLKLVSAQSLKLESRQHFMALAARAMRQVLVDHARAIDTIFHRGKVGDTYNIGGFNEWRNIDLIRVVIRTVDRLLGRSEGASEHLITYVTDRAGHDLRYAIDSRKLKDELG